MKQGAQTIWDRPLTLREGLDPPRPKLRHGPYVVVRLLGRGGMAVVHIVRRSPDDGERYAMKRILPELANIRPFARSFANEARLGERLVHPNIVRVVDFGEQDGELALVTEYIDGTSCARLLSAASRGGTGLPHDVAIFITREILSALGHIHDATDDADRPLSIVHRDVSPGNILIGAMGEVKLADFGVARFSDPAFDSHSDALEGKLGYMAPEQFAGAPVDRRSDLFSLGVVLFEMLTGQPFFGSVDELELAAKMREVPLSPLSEPRGRELPLELRLILATALARDPVDRFADAAEFEDALRRFARRSGMSIERRRLVHWLRCMDIWPLRSGTYPAVSSGDPDATFDDDERSSSAPPRAG